MSVMQPQHPHPRHTWIRVSVTVCLGLILGLMLGIATQALPVSLVLGAAVGIGTAAALEQQHRREKVELDQALWAFTPLLVFAAITLIIWFEIQLW